MELSGAPTLDLTLRCEACGLRQRLKAYLRLTKFGTLRVQAGAVGWYVDGEHVLCARCVPARLRDNPAQRESWDKHDRRHARQWLAERTHD